MKSAQKSYLLILLLSLSPINSWAEAIGDKMKLRVSILSFMLPELEFEIKGPVLQILPIAIFA